jgi:integrase
MSTNGKFTDLKIKNLPAKDKQYELFDPTLANFGIRISPGGTKSFVLYYYLGRKKSRLTLGRYPDLSLSDAREMARTAQKRIAAGQDPHADKLRDRDQHHTTVFSSVVARYIENYAKVFTQSSVATQRILNNDFGSHWAKLQIGAIDKKMVLKRLEEIRKRQGPSAANHGFTALRAFFNWCLAQDILSETPCRSLKKPAPENSRDRVLNDDEIASVWSGTEKMGYPFGPFVQLLILTGQRRNEVAKLRWSELDFDQNIWLQRDNKSKRAHVVPLSPQAVSVLKRLPRLSDEFVFPARGSDRAISGFSKWKKKLDHLSRTNDWTLHDLRRTCATKLAQLGVEPHVTEFVLNHSSRMMTGVASVYNRHAYIDEKRQALEQWANHLHDELCDTNSNKNEVSSPFQKSAIIPAGGNNKGDSMIMIGSNIMN